MSADYRRARADDSARLAAMRLAMRVEGGEAPGPDQAGFLDRCSEYYRCTINDPVETHWVAAIGERIVGTVSLHRVRMIPRPCRFDDSFGCITNNYVLPELRGRGIAGGLLAQVAAAAAAEELELLIVWPSERAVPFYARAGFLWENEVMELRLRDHVPISAPPRG